MKFFGVIPARYASTRFPGKPLALLDGKPIIQHVCENAGKALDQVWVATDDERIAQCVAGFNGQVVMTRADHQSGTDRCAEAAQALAAAHDFDVVINVQGDEPFVRLEQIEALKACFDDSSTDIATLVKVIEDSTVLFNPNRPKVVVDCKQNALLFSREAIPHIRGVQKEDWLAHHQFYSHLGMYAYRKEVLQQLTQLEPSRLELAESLEQLRWLENGLRIKVGQTQFESIGIDTPEDLEAARQFLEDQRKS
ncbi:3-deoxy-manno-octulosonate cytidylyltransferase [uncultured Sunxiuqinia sp.]|uniref:3-deoxy-manno-octulosonate cytidylyltransferase n=1 Tax=uncultured Sunxiuqinia sp. TaxID=1573825 RepID=UPI0026283630|nr:3-deoxy-manno-octulosonate cytidylyltransferase [uncultured Sunxiuqinia sp.]